MLKTQRQSVHPGVPARGSALCGGGMNAVILTAVLSAGNSGMYALLVCCTPWRVTVKRRAFSLNVAWWRAA